MARRALFLILILLVPGAALAQSSWAVAERSGDQVASLVSKLMPFVDKLPGQKDADAVVLYAQMQYRVDKAAEKTEWCRNYVLEVRDPEGLQGPAVSPTFRSDYEIDSVHAFRLRNDGFTKLSEEQVTLTVSEEQHRRHTVALDFGDLKKGDVIGWSVLGSQKGLVFGDHVAMGDRYPVVIANLKIDTGSAVTYRMVGRGLPPKDIDFTEKELVNSRPTAYGATMRALPAQEVAWEQGPMPEDFPHVWFYQDESFMEGQAPIPDGWMKFQGWNLMAMFMHGMSDQAAKKTKGLDMVLGALTSGKSDVVAREEAIYKFVQEKIELVEGPGIERKGFRTPEEILKSREGNGMEKAMLMTVMLREAECPAAPALVRATDYGALEENAQSLVQFSDLIVRAGEGDAPRFYAPQCGDCPPGTLPASWRGVPAFSPKSGLTEVLETFQQELIKTVTTGTPPTPSQLGDLREENDWYRLETTPTSQP